MRFSQFDKRRYETVSPTEGYDEWAESYDSTVPDLLDIRMLEQVDYIDWAGAGKIADLACGTGRTGAWLKGQGARSIDGVDASPKMLGRARDRGIYDRLELSDIAKTPLPSSAYGIAVAALVDEHLPGLDGLYSEAARLAAAGGWLVVVGYHPHFMLMSGIAAHFKRPGGENISIESYVHLFSDHFKAATANGWTLYDLSESCIDDRWLEVKPKWREFMGHPVSYLAAWKRG